MSDRRGDKSHHRSRLLEDIKFSRRHAANRLPASIPEGRVPDKLAAAPPSGVRSGGSKHHHHHGRELVAVVAKPKHKRSDYRRLRAIMEAPYDEAFRRAQRRRRKELLNRSAASGVFLRTAGTAQPCSPYAASAACGSDSEYSAECASLFHSTIADTSEDERSDYTADCFGDSESSGSSGGEEEDSDATGDTEESGGGGTGRGRSQLAAATVANGRVAKREMTPAQAKAFVKIKASHNLKKKILRFRSGSLKLMTTV